VWAAAISRHRGGVDNGAALFEVGQGRFGHKEMREDIGAESLYELILRNICQAVLRELNPRVVDQDVQVAVLIDSALDRLAAEILLPDVAGDQQAALPLLFHLAA
jgi:hypothetical protein